ncbi:MAG TPA: hypothetical protein VK593_01055 [Edaphobacter sp.]|nr:hypothetical protein [Edaphobacter sp.]
MNDDLNISVATPEAAALLQQDFDELLARVNGDFMFQSMNPLDPISVETAIVNAERSIDAHMQEFAANAALQSLSADIKLRFRASIEQQARESTKCGSE